MILNLDLKYGALTVFPCLGAGFIIWGYGLCPSLVYAQWCGFMQPDPGPSTDACGNVLGLDAAGAIALLSVKVLDSD